MSSAPALVKVDLPRIAAFIAGLPQTIVNLVAIHPSTLAVCAITRQRDDPRLLDFVDRHAQHNLYWTINEPVAGLGDVKPGKADIAVIHHLAVDLDPRADRNHDALLKVASDAIAQFSGPNFAVDSGNGVQLFWRIQPTPATPEAVSTVEAQARGLERLYDSDAVHNVDRIMRLPYTTNWPTNMKRARGRIAAPARLLGRNDLDATIPLDSLKSTAEPIAEPAPNAGHKAYTGLLLWPPDEPSADLRRRLARALDRDDTLRARWLGDATGLRDNSRSGFDFVVGGALRRYGFSAEEAASLLHEYPYGRNFDMDERYFRRIWGRGGSPSALEDFTPVGGADASAKIATGFNLLNWTADRYAGPAPETRWLIDGMVPLGVPGMVAAMGGLGKTWVALQFALAVACPSWTGGQILGGSVAEHGTAVVLCAEDGQAALHRRLEALDPTGERLKDANKLIVVPLPDAGGPMPLIAVHQGTPVKTSAFAALESQLEALPDLKLVIIDPLQTFVMADVNSDPAAGQYLWSSLAALCAKTGATIAVMHHMRKQGLSEIKTLSDAREAIRGSTALVDGSRWTYALWAETETDARKVCAANGVPYEWGRCVRGGMVKANDAARMTIQTYLREAGGYLTDRTDATDTAGIGISVTFSDAHTETILQDIATAWDEGAPYCRGDGGARPICAHIAKITGRDPKDCKAVLAEWLADGVVEEVILDTRTRRKGLKRSGAGTAVLPDWLN